MKKAAIFLDRDGTLIEDAGILRRPEDLRILPGVVPALQALQEDYLLFIVTHQPHIARGELRRTEAEAVNVGLADRLRREGITITAGYICPHTREEGCRCIKPEPAFPRAAAEQYGLDLERSWSVGDHPHDVELGVRFGGDGIYVLTGHGSRHREALVPGRVVVPGLREAAQWIRAEQYRRTQGGSGDREVRAAAAALRSGNLVVMPTDTVYGLAAVAFQEEAVARVFEVKQRPYFDPLIVHVAGPEALDTVVQTIPPAARALMEVFWPGPLTLVLPKKPRVPDLVTAGLGSVAVRMPCHPLALALLRETGAPLAAPSANLFGRISPTTVADARAELGAGADLYLDGGPCAVGVESTVLSFLETPPRLLRPGGLPLEEIEAVIGSVQTAPPAAGMPAASPGMLPRHYAPNARLVLWEAGDPLPADASRAALLSALPLAGAVPFARVEILSEAGDPYTAAARLFATLRRLDAAGIERIYARPGPEEGLWRAINDRLRRAQGVGDG